MVKQSATLRAGMAVVAYCGALVGTAQGVEPQWVGSSSTRILVRVLAVPLGSRPSDEMPAQVHVDFAKMLASGSSGERADLSTLQVVRYDPSTGKPIPYHNYLCGKTEFDRPVQWYDDDIPDPFPDRDRSVQSRWVNRSQWGYYYEVIGSWKSGRVAWTHTQEGDRPSHYAIYFDLLKEDEKQTSSAPRGWIGDGSKRTAPIGRQSTGIYHVDCQMIDFNQDGLLDLVCGSSRGAIAWYENLGTRQKPKFTVARMLFHADGKPIDPGFLSTPTATDWDHDGNLDLLVGANKGWVYFYRNVGTNVSPRYEDRGAIQVEGKALRVPAEPVPEVEGPKGEIIYKEDYEPFIEVVDWDGDGDDDLLIGGYVTGRIFWYENTGRDATGTPLLRLNGHLTADGKPLDVGWAANPTAADLNGDGDLDLVVGVWRKWGNDSPPEIVEDFLAYFENTGTRTKPVLSMKPLPRIGKFPDEIITSPTLADWDDDGDLDLAVTSHGGSAYLFENVGDRRRPKFDVRRPRPLEMPWGNDPLPRNSDSAAPMLADWNGDGALDLVHGGWVALNTRDRLPWAFAPFKPILPENQTIDHRAWRGDDWAFTLAVDFDQDGRKDILFADYWGNVWFHKNTSIGDQSTFDTQGVRIQTEAGTPLSVGRTSSSPYDFDTMQGPRTSLAAADFDADGSVDLVLNDVFGHYYYCKRGRHGTQPVVESQVPLAEMGGYATSCVVDWDGDGRPDLLVSQLQNHLLLQNAGGSDPHQQFDRPRKLELPLVPVIGAVVHVLPMEINRDGDRDLLIQSDHGYDCYFEGSFLEHGYAKGENITLQRK